MAEHFSIILQYRLVIMLLHGLLRKLLRNELVTEHGIFRAKKTLDILYFNCIKLLRLPVLKNKLSKNLREIGVATEKRVRSKYLLKNSC